MFPGCGRTRWVDAHHIKHWADHGPTRPDNLVLLCRHHHRAIHEGGYTITGNPEKGPVSFHRPDGTLVNPNCEHIGPVTVDHADRWLQSLAPGLEPDTITGHFVGDPLQLSYVVGCVIDTEQPHDHPDYRDATPEAFADQRPWQWQSSWNL